MTSRVNPPSLELQSSAERVILVVETETGSSAEERTLREAVRTVLEPDGAWRVERLFHAHADPDPLDRFFRVVGHVTAPGPVDAAAFERAYRLSAATGFHIQPDLPTRYAPDEAEPAPEVPLNDLRTEKPPPGWVLDKLHCREAWALTPMAGGAARGAGIIVAQPDSGYTLHPGLGPGTFDLRLGADVLEGDNNALDPLEHFEPLLHPGHGTSTGGALAGRRVDIIEGVAPEATLVPIRTLKSVVQIFDSDVARAIEHARRVGAHVISMSLGGDGFIGLEQEIDRAVAEGIIVLAAAGNEWRWVVAPARYRNCIAVAASNIAARPWERSARGRKVAISAPGEDVHVASWRMTERPPQPEVHPYSGTSFAVAHTAGIAALWLAHHGREQLLRRYGPARLQAAFLHVIQTHGHHCPPGWDTKRFGVGIVDAHATLTAPLPAPAELGEPMDVLSAPEGAGGPGQRLAALFPELSTEEVRRRLVALAARGPGAEGAVEASLERHEAEWFRLFSTRPDAWDALASTPAPRVADPAGEPVRAMVRTFGSPSLVGLLGG